MAKTSIALAELVEKGSQDDVVRELLGHVVERLMDFEIEQRCGASYGERSDDRSNSRNGYRERHWDRRAPAASTCASPSCVKAATFPASSSHGAPRRRR